MTIALIHETKIPEDNRVILSPKQMRELKLRYPFHNFIVQASPTRAFTDDEYRAEGIEVRTSLDDADILFGIKEPRIDSLIPNKHYFSFGHIAKQQPYNRPLMHAFIDKGITFTDYEYLTDDNGQRVCAFGWWAGVVGCYYSLQGYGLKHGSYSLPKPDRNFTLEHLFEALNSIKLPKIKIIVTGTGRVSTGAQYVLYGIGAKRLTREELISDRPVDKLSYFVADLPDLVRRIDDDSQPFDMHHFFEHPSLYESRFMEIATSADLLLSCHFWDPKAPVYLSAEDLRNPRLHLDVIGDITCDIMGSIKSTLRPATHAQPFYDFNPTTESEEPLFASKSNITVMAVDTCPNALPRDTSQYFGQMLIEHVLPALLDNDADSRIIDNATIVRNGQLTPHYSYLKAYAAK